MSECFINIKENLIQNKKNRKKFNEYEDNKLLNLVHQYSKNWMKIGILMNRNQRACKERYEHYLQAKYISWHWTIEEKMKLILLRGKLKYNWDLINKMFPLRAPKLIKNQWYYLLKKPFVQAIISQKNNQVTINQNIIDDKEILFDFSEFCDF